MQTKINLQALFFQQMLSITIIFVITDVGKTASPSI
jgi:hypothetical protein